MSVSVCAVIGAGPSSRVRVRAVIQLAAAPIGYVRVQLGRREVRMAEHLLDAAEIRPSLEQVWMDALGVEPCPCGPPAKDQERACAGERAALGVQEELRPAAAVEVRPAAGEVAAQGLGGRTPDRHDPLLAALAETADEALV